MNVNEANGRSVTVAGIDCGTNSIRLKISRVDGRGYEDLLPRVLRVVRLGQGVDRTHRFAQDALDRTYAAAREFADMLADYRIDGVRFVATSATRDAENREEFEQTIENILGVRPEVIPGTEEARLSFLGATSVLEAPLGGGRRPKPPYLVVDLGGGSTELVLGGDGVEASADAVTHAFSMNIGSVRMTERHLHTDPPTEAEITEAIADVDAHIDEAHRSVPFERTGTIIGVSGTVTTMTALQLGLPEYDHSAVDGKRVRIDDITAVDDRFTRMTRADRRAYKTIHPGRVDVVGGGALVWNRVLAKVAESANRLKPAGDDRIDSYVASEHGLLDGIVLDYGRRLLANG